MKTSAFESAVLACRCGWSATGRLQDARTDGRGTFTGGYFVADTTGQAQQSPSG